MLDVIPQLVMDTAKDDAEFRKSIPRQLLMVKMQSGGGDQFLLSEEFQF